MKKIFNWYYHLSNRTRKSLTITISVIGIASTVLSIFGISLANWESSTIWARIGLVIGACVLLFLAAYFIIGKLYKESVSFIIRNTAVEIKRGDIFEETGWRVIGCDSRFDTRIDDIVISKKSLHGQLFREHGNIEEIKAVIACEAQKRNLELDSDGLYRFPLGTVIRYNSSIDNGTYLLLAMAELDRDYKTHTNMAKYEHMLMTMWSEIDRVYASNTVVLPLLGAGISRFDDGPKDNEALLKCMLCTLNGSGVSLNSEVKVILYGDAGNFSLYEYKDLFRSVQAT